MADRREQLLDAYKEHNEEAKPDTEGDADEAVVESKEADAGDADSGDEASSDKADVSGGADNSGRGEKSKSAKSDPGKSEDGAKDSKAQPKADAPKGAKEDAGKAKALEQAERAAAEAGEAPKAWKVGTREHWVKLPKEVREEVQRREMEITQFIGRHGAAIQHKAQFDEVVQPFMPFIAAQQSTPMKAFHNLMTTAARLTTGAPQAKAAVISEIMDTYGIDVETLDAVLSAKMAGKSVGGGAPVQSAPPAWANPVFEFINEAKQSKQQREQQVQAQANAELAEMEKKPFFSDLREDIGLLMQRAATRGELMTLDQAYQKARKMNAEVDKVLTQRERAATQTNGQSTIEKARKAASAVRGSPGAGAANGAAHKAADKPVDRRAAIEAAIASLSDD